MPATNTSVLAYGTILRLGNGIFGAGTSQVSTIAFASAPAAGSVTLSFWGISFTFSTVSGLPTAAALQALLNGIFGTTYTNPFTVALAANTYTVTAGGPFAFRPLPAFVTVANTSAVAITHTITVPGVTQETFATVSGVETMPFPSPQADVETYTSFDLGNAGYKSKIKKLKDAGTVNLGLIFRNDATQNNITGLQSLFESSSAFDWEVAVPTRAASPTITAYGYVDTFTAFLSQYQVMGAAADDRLKVTATLAIDGAVSRLPPLV